MIVTRDSRTVRTELRQCTATANMSYRSQTLLVSSVHLDLDVLCLQTDDEFALKSWRSAGTRELRKDWQKLCERWMHMRVVLFALQSQRYTELDASRPIEPGLLRHSAALSRYRKIADSLLADSRRTGRPWRNSALQFGERSHFKPGPARSGDALPRRPEGRYVGDHDRFGSVMVRTVGLLCEFTTNRKNELFRWKANDIRDLKGLPCELPNLELEGRQSRPWCRTYAHATCWVPRCSVADADRVRIGVFMATLMHGTRPRSSAGCVAFWSPC